MSTAADELAEQTARAVQAEAERDEARQIVRDIHWMARRYATGRQTYAASMFNAAISKALAGGWLGENGREPVFADDPADLRLGDGSAA